MTYQSSVMRCNTGDDDCPVCRYLNETDPALADIVEVIRVLDRSLADQEKYNRELVRVVTAQAEKIKELS